MTRPLGASIGDYLSQSTADGDLGRGTVMTSALFLAICLGLVIRLTSAPPKAAEANEVLR